MPLQCRVSVRKGWFEQESEDSEEWRAMMEWDGGRWARFVYAFREYEEVDEGTEYVP